MKKMMYKIGIVAIILLSLVILNCNEVFATIITPSNNQYEPIINQLEEDIITSRNELTNSETTLDASQIATLNSIFINYEGKRSGSEVRALMYQIDSYNHNDSSYFSEHPITITGITNKDDVKVNAWYVVTAKYEETGVVNEMVITSAEDTTTTSTENNNTVLTTGTTSLQTNNTVINNNSSLSSNNNSSLGSLNSSISGNNTTNNKSLPKTGKDNLPGILLVSAIVLVLAVMIKSYIKNK